MSTNTTSSPAIGQVRDHRAVVAIAWPTGRPIYPYTPQELADGVDLYTCYLKGRRERGERGERDA
ncbi:hypothetical protein [Jidongwangia harbinensis]|uniref:hypothetical protein n=1 Tax=Jidongwangia harbinensis TaxID=2878561 RepID=UPI001CDA4C39|nr:hypothetical protein [Jidongwangia harbinensis]MCA2216361.1 hypothetical protein [Jidongwangia harbinensis]MCA2217096.1 hypothetical protein [Jidongwangia harbinensis]